MGPFHAKDEAVNMGVACHIYSASENGPRGQGNKNSEFLGSEENGIWCCQYHANLIDKNNGVDYPVSTLFMWKKLAEARVLKEMNDIPSPLGWVESINFTTFMNNHILPSIKLSRFTLLYGRNGTGKSSLLEFSASISNSKYSDRFINTKVKNNSEKYELAIFNAEVIYSTVDSFSKKISLKIENSILSRTENDKECLLPPGDLEIIFCSDIKGKQKENEDDIDFMMNILNVDKSALFALTKIGTKSLMAGKIKFEHAEEDDEDDYEKTHKKYKENRDKYFELLFKRDNSNHYVSFNCLSTSEQAKLILDLQITKARETSKQRLTLLLIEELIYNFQEDSFKSLLSALEQEEFQTIVSIPQWMSSDILNIEKDNISLKNLDYLEQWKLEILKSS